MTDVTPRPDADQPPSATDLWESAFDAIAVGIAIVDQTGHTIRCNRALCDLAACETPGIADLDGQFFGDRKVVASAASSVARGNRPIAFVEKSIDGRSLSLTFSPFRGDLVVVVVADLTDQQRFESRLIQTEKMAAVGQLVSGVAHELNNPLASISGLSELMLERSEKGTREWEHLRVIHEESSRAGDIVRNLLTFARRDHEAAAGPVDLNKVVSNAVELVRYEMKMRHIESEVLLAPDLPTVRGERIQLQLVVLNLLSNASHALEDADQASPRIEIHTLLREGECVLTVADNGPGMPDEVMTKVFTPFFTTKEPGSGTGLGLALTYAIVERFGGVIRASNRPEGGAQFEIAFPVYSSLDRTESLPAEQPTAIRRSDPGSRHRMLLLDEDRGIRRMVSAVFGDIGIQVVTAQSGADGMQFLRDEKFDLIVADPRTAINPRTTVSDLIEGTHPELLKSTVYLTADVRPETIDLLRNSGVAAFLTKPFKVAELRNAVEKLLPTEE